MQFDGVVSFADVMRSCPAAGRERVLSATIVVDGDARESATAFDRAASCEAVLRCQERLGLSDEAVIAVLAAYADGRRVGAQGSLSDFLSDFIRMIEQDREEQAFVTRVFDGDPPAEASAEVVMPDNPAVVSGRVPVPNGVCGVCGGPVYETPSGTVCGAGHGGAPVVIPDNPAPPVVDTTQDAGAVLVRQAFGQVDEKKRQQEVQQCAAQSARVLRPGSRIAYHLGDQTILGVVTYVTPTHADFVADNSEVYRQIALTYLKPSDQPVSVKVVLGATETNAARKCLEGPSVEGRVPNEVLVDVCYKELVAADGSSICLILDVVNGVSNAGDAEQTASMPTPFLLYRIENTERKTLVESPPDRGELAGVREISYLGIAYRLEVATTTATVRPSKKKPKAAAAK